MQRKEEHKCIEVKAVVTEVLGSKSKVIYDGGAHRDCEREAWLERREMFECLRGRRHGSHIFLERDDLDDILPRRDYYVEDKTKVRAHYAVDGQVYERETALSCAEYECRAGKKIYLTIDPARPDEILKTSLYKSWSLADELWIDGMLALMVVFFVVILFLLHRYQVR